MDLKKIRQTRLEGLTDTIDFYQWTTNEGFSLSEEQRKQLLEVRNAIQCFGEDASCWVELADEILSK